MSSFFASFSGTGGGIAHWTHLSGLAVGFLYLKAAPGWFHWLRFYHRRKLERNKRRFKLYYRQTRQEANDKDYPPTIH